MSAALLVLAVVVGLMPAFVLRMARLLVVLVLATPLVLAVALTRRLGWWPTWVLTLRVARRVVAWTMSELAEPKGKTA